MKKFTLNLAKDLSGGDFSITGYKIGKGKPSVYIQGGMHGGETTYWIIHELLKKIDENKINGSLTVIPICNPISWQHKNYFYTAGKFWYYNGKDWNRFFPGDKKGSTPARLAHILFQEVKKHDLVIDLHTSRVSKPYIIYTNEKNEEFIKYLGFRYNQIFKTRKTLNYACYKADINCLTIECGSHDSYNAKNINQCLQALINLFKYLKILNGKAEKFDNLYNFEKTKNYYADHAGFIKFLKKPGDSYKKGEALFTIYPSDDISRQINVKGQEDGVILKISPTHVYNQGNSVAEIIEQKNLKKI